MAGTLRLDGEGVASHQLTEGDAFVIPPGMATRYAEPSETLELLEVTLPGTFKTTLIPDDTAPPGCAKN